MVIGNILQTRRNRVVFVMPANNYEVVLSREQILNGMEIEDPIVVDVVACHSDFISTHKY